MKVLDKIHKTVLSYCEPLFLSSPLLSDGHNYEKANATITFIEYQRRVFGVTCAHVYDQQVTSGKWLTLHGNGRYVFELGKFTQDGYQSLFRTLRVNSKNEYPDIAVIELGESVRSTHFIRKGKKPISLDDWNEPEWPNIQIAAAFGYPTEHKLQSNLTIKSPLCSVAAEVTNPISELNESFLLHSSLKAENNVFFSGMSGGPVFHIVDPFKPPILIEIVYEGTPGSSKEWNERGEQSFLTNKHIQIKAHTLTPKIFDQWLRVARFL